MSKQKRTHLRSLLGGERTQIRCSQWDNFLRKKNIKDRFGPSGLSEGKGKRQ